MKARLAITLVTLALTTTLASCAGGGPSRSTVEKQYDGAGVIITGQTLTSTLARDVAGRVTDFTLVET